MIEFLADSHTYLVDGVIKPSVSEIIAPLTQAHYKDLNQEIVEKAGTRGSAIHKATEKIDLGEEYEIEDKWKDYILQYKKFKALRKPKIIAVEQQLTNGDYCGTIDRIFEINGEKWLIDIKSSAEVNRKLVDVQLGGYKGLTKANKIKVDKYGVLHLTKTGFKLVEIDPNEKVFKSLFEIWKYLESEGK
jgi:hypothetical protein